MEKYIVKEDVTIFCVTARSFPGGIIEAFKALEKLHPSICERPFYGISYEKEPGRVIYKAAVAETYDGEGKKYGCEIFVITNGEYLTETIFDFMKNIDSIPAAFQKLTSDPRFDKNFPRVEWYKSSKEIMCMIKIKQYKN